MFEDRDLLDVTLKDVGHLHLACALDGCRGITAADHAGLDVMPGQPAEGYSILSVERFGLDHAALRVRREVDLAVSQRSVDIHQEKLDAVSKVEAVQPRVEQSLRDS